MSQPLTWSSQWRWDAPGLVWNGVAPTKGKIMPNHVSLGFTKLKDAELVPFATGVHDHLVTNAATFTSPPVTPAVLKTATDDFAAKLGAAFKGSVAQTEAKDAARVVLEDLLRQLAAYVEGKAMSDADMIRDAGFDVVSHGRSPQTQLTKPDIKTVQNVISTQLKLVVTAVKNAQAYEVQIRIGTGAWTGAGTFPQARSIVLTGLTPGVLYDLRVRAIGGSTGFSDWSDVTSHMAT